MTAKSTRYNNRIPAKVRYCNSIEMGARMLYVEINALTVNGYCHSTNAYFSGLFEINERTIQRWLKSLREQNFINIEQSEDGLRKIQPIA